MTIDIFRHDDAWQEIKDAAMNTVGKSFGKYPDSEWKKKMILSEHSPIRLMRFYWRWTGLKSWVSVHFVRHKIGIEHFVSTQRTDRTGIDRDALPQGSLVRHACDADAQALINISRKRLCSCASQETREAWQKIKDKVAETEPELASCMVRECVYRGFCPEMFGCGYDKTDAYKKELEEYRRVQKEGTIVCKYCDFGPDDAGYPANIETKTAKLLMNTVDFHIAVGRGYANKIELEVDYYDGYTWHDVISAPINFCPMCGKKLENKEEQSCL